MFDTCPVIDHPAAYSVAEDVARRYGVVVSPAVVRQVRPGASARPLPVWDGCKLVFPVDSGLSWKSAAETRKRAGQSPVILKRRAEVRRLHGLGLSDTEVAVALGIDRQLAYQDRRTMELPDNSHLRISRQQEEQKARVLAMIAVGMDSHAVAAALGVKEHYAAGLMRQLGWVRPKPPKSMPNPVGNAKPRGPLRNATQAKAEARRAQVAAHLATLAGPPSYADIEALAARFGVNRKILHRDLRALKVAKPPRPYPAGTAVRFDRQRAVRREQVAAMAAEGKSVAEMARVLKAQRQTVREDLAALGLQNPKLVATSARLDALRDRLRQLRAEGKEYDEMAAITGISKSTIWYHLSRMGLIRPGDGQEGRA